MTDRHAEQTDVLKYGKADTTVTPEVDPGPVATVQPWPMLELVVTGIASLCPVPLEFFYHLTIPNPYIGVSAGTVAFAMFALATVAMTRRDPLSKDDTANSGEGSSKKPRELGRSGFGFVMAADAVVALNVSSLQPPYPDLALWALGTVSAISVLSFVAAFAPTGWKWVKSAKA